MKVEVLKFAAAVHPEVLERAIASLKLVPGVQEASFLDAPARVLANIDDAATARAELVNVLARYGVSIAEEKPAHGNGGCCGGCGGSN